MVTKQLTNLVIRVDRGQRDGDREGFVTVQATPAMSFPRHPHLGLLAMPNGRCVGRGDRGGALRAGRLASLGGSAIRRRLAISAGRTIQSGWSRQGLLDFAGAAAFTQRLAGRKQETTYPDSLRSVELTNGEVVPAATTRGA